MADHQDPRPAILVVEDHASIAETIALYLQSAGFETARSSNGEDALARFKSRIFSLVLLDVMLPGRDGLSVLETIRESSELPVILLTAKSTEEDIITGLEAGADDYITKPFKPGELVARVRSHLRRVRRPQQVEQLTCGQLSLDLQKHVVYLDGGEIKLTKTEFSLLKMMIKRPGMVFTRNQLIEGVFGYDYDGDERSLVTHLYNLRRKIEHSAHKPEYLHTEYGVGYRFEYRPLPA